MYVDQALLQVAVALLSQTDLTPAVEATHYCQAAGMGEPMRMRRFHPTFSGVTPEKRRNELPIRGLIH